jgi:uncharacterized membrane protein
MKLIQVTEKFLLFLQHYPFPICIQVRTTKKVSKLSPKKKGRTTLKKLIPITLCAVMALAFTGCSNDSTAKDSAPKQTTGDNKQIPNPYVDCDTFADAGKIAGFTVIVPESIPTGYKQDSIRVVNNELVEITYVNGEKKLSFRQGKGSEDISGNYNEYKENNTKSVGSLQVTTKGDNGKISLATWTAEGYTFSISADSLDYQEISDMINSMKPDTGVVGKNVRISSPFIDCDTIDVAGKIAGFTVTVPEKMPQSYVQKSIVAVENKMVQVIYANGEKEILIRKAKGNEDISGNFSEYTETNTVTVGSIKVSTRGDNGKINVATWVDGEYTYSITANSDEKGLDTTAISNMVGGIR